MNGKRKSQRITIDNLKQMVIDSDETVWSVQQLADNIGTTADAIRKRIQRGTIKAHKQGHSWYILKSEYIAGLRAL
mgnify:FL=1